MADENGFVIANNVIYDYYGEDTKVVIPNGITGISSSAFSGCTNITSIDIPDSVTYIGDRAFSSCEGLADENGLIIVGNVLYGYCGDGGDVVIPDGVTEICSSVFNSRQDITSIDIPDSVTTIGSGAFSWCTGLTADEDGFVILNDILVIYKGDDADVVVPDGVTTIEYEAFANNSDIASVTLPDSVTTISSYAFYYCGLTSITLSKNIKRIDESAFVGSDLTDVYYAGSAIDWYNTAGASGDLLLYPSSWGEEGFGNAYCLMAATIHYTEDSSEYALGDVNEDGSIDYLDAMSVLRSDAELITLTDEQLTLGDVNGDGSVDSLDAILILRYDAGLIDEF